MKKSIFSAFLTSFAILCLFSALVFLPASAEGPTLSCSTVFEAETGKTYDVTVSYSGLAGKTIGGISIEASWDKDSLELVSASLGSGVTADISIFTPLAQSNVDGVCKWAGAYYGDMIPGDSGELFALTFRVKTGARGFSPVGLRILNFGESDDKDYSPDFSITNGGISTTVPDIRLVPDHSASAFIREDPSVGSVSLSFRALEDFGERKTQAEVAALFSIPGGAELRFAGPNGSALDPSLFVGTGTAVELFWKTTKIDSLIAVVKGDGDGNGSCDVFDAVALLSYVVDPVKVPLSDAALYALNVDASGEVDVFDAVEVLTFIVRGNWRSGGFLTGPEVLSSMYYDVISGKPEKSGTLFYYYTVSATPVTPDLFIETYNGLSGSLKGVFSVSKGVGFSEELKTTSSVSSYRYVAVTVFDGEYSTPCVVPRSFRTSSSSGFSSGPDAGMNGSTDVLTFTPEVGGTVYCYYTQNAEAPDAVSFANAYRSAPNGIARSFQAVSGVSSVGLSLGVSVDPDLSRIAVMLVGADGVFYRPVLLTRSEDPTGFLVAPIVLSYLTNDKMTGTPNKNGTLFYYYADSPDPVLPEDFASVYYGLSDDVKGVFSVFKGIAFSQSLKGSIPVSDYKYVIIVIYEGTYSVPVVVCRSELFHDPPPYEGGGENEIDLGDVP